jgi:hypothetical protein
MRYAYSHPKELLDLGIKSRSTMISRFSLTSFSFVLNKELQRIEKAVKSKKTISTEKNNRATTKYDL